MNANKSADRKIVTLQPLFLKREDAAAFLSISSAMLERLVAKDQAPKPRKLSSGRVAWLVEELIAWGLDRPVSDLLPARDSGYGRAGKEEQGQGVDDDVATGGHHG